MKRRDFLKVLSATSVPLLSGCGFWRIDPMHFLIRSDVIDSPEKEAEIVSRASLTYTDDLQVRVIFLRGTAYERGYQHGRLLRKEVQDNIGYIYHRALQKFRSEELFAEAFDRMRPYMPQDYIDEMRGLAHGSKLPLHVIHHVHVLADIGEWGGKKRLGKVLKQMMEGTLATTCSNFAVSKSATADGKLYAVRILDWGLHKISKLHQYPLIAVSIPETGVASANVGWVGYLGAISGMNEAGITLGEMGYRNPPNETLDGMPMPFMLREVLTHASSLADVRRIIRDTRGTNSYVFLMTDGKSGEAQMYVKDRERFLAFDPGVEVNDEKEILPALKDIVYGGRFNETMTTELRANSGALTPDLFKEKLIPDFAMKSNFQNVIYDPADLRLWVTNAKDSASYAWENSYTYFDFKKALGEYRDKFSLAKK